MDLNFGQLNWLAILVCVLVAQAFLTVWFAVVFKKPWAQEYGVEDPKQHTQEIPGYTYGLGAACAFLLTLGLAVLQSGFEVKTVGQGLQVGFFVALHFGVAIALPGYAFLKRYRAFVLALGSQFVLVMVLSTILALWQ